ncbi:MAG: sterol desaturase family protein [Bacillota bacterium]
MRKHVMEFLRYPDIQIMGLLTLAVAGFALSQAPRPQVWFALLVGVGLFFISEYTTHRFFFHMAPPKSPLLRKAIYRLHYHHHEEPNDLHLLFLPIWYSIPQFFISGSIAWWVTGDIRLAAGFLTGSMGLLMYYEWLHYVAHRPVTPLTPWGRWMKKYHLWHHFKNEHYWYGVTNPSLDMLLGTYKEVADVEKSPTARKLDPGAEVAASVERGR